MSAFPRRDRRIWAALACVPALAIAGCRAKPKNWENDNDALRRRVAQLEAEVASASARAVEAEAKLAEVAKARATVLEGEALKALPMVAGISIGRFSGLSDDDDDGRPDAVDIYVRPYDGRQRFVQVAGAMKAETFLLPRTTPGGPAPDPVRLGEASFSPTQVREAYRSSPLGTHYLLRVPIAAPPSPDGEVVMRVELVDPISGAVHRAEKIVGASGQ